MQNEIAGNFEQKIANEENTGAKSVNPRAESEVLVHLQSREPDVHAIQKCDEEANDHQGQQAPPHLCHRLDANSRDFHQSVRPDLAA